MTSKSSIYTYTENKLTALFQNDSEFLEHFAQINMFYQNKFLKIVGENQKEKFFNLLFQAVKSQFFNGYFLFRELLDHEDSTFENEWFLQPQGYIIQDIPHILKDAIGIQNFDNVVQTDVMQKLIEWAITEFEDIYDNLKQIAYDVVCLGALQAVLDERTLRGLTSEELEAGLIFPIHDFTFITPQHFMSCNYITIDTEKWDIYFWATLENKDIKAGEVIISEVSTQEGEKEYILNIYIHCEVIETERNIILERVVKTLMEQQKVSSEDIHLHYAVVNDFFVSPTK